MDKAFLEGILGDSPEAVEAIMAQHRKELDDMAFAGVLSKVICDAGGRNEKAVAALLDVESIRSSEDPKQAAVQAVQQLKQEQDYLFVQSAPRYAPGTGTGTFTTPEPKSLADALKQKFGK